ncbi:MAG: fasciclin domain-containing protein [Planctomycetota bacterium]
MTFAKYLAVPVAAAGLSLFAAPTATLACTACGCSAPAAAETEPGNIVEVAADAGDFSTLLAAAQAAGLAETLSTGGPFTVLAPTDAAFAALPEGTVDSLLLPENKEQLKAVLLYHVIDGTVKAETVVTLDEATTLQGSTVDIEASGGGVTINGANVTATDVMASNGVIHVIDAVLLPPAE